MMMSIEVVFLMIRGTRFEWALFPTNQLLLLFGIPYHEDAVRHLSGRIIVHFKMIWN